MLEFFTVFRPTTLEKVLVKRDSSTSSGGMPTLSSSSSTSTGMPKLKTTSSSSSSFSTPSVTVPPSNNNPYLIRENHPSGTVFIAVGAILGAIIVGFILYHIIRSLMASKMAKKSSSNYEKLGNNSAYGGSITPGSTLNLNSEYQLSVARIPMMNHQRSRSALSGLGGLGGGNINGSQTDSSTVYGSEAAASKHDVTKMFISPTAEVMRHKRTKSQFSGSTTTLNTSPPYNTMSQIPNLYINEENNSDYSLATHSTNTNSNTNTSQGRDAKRTPRKTIPSMYLEDLIDKE